MDPVLLETGLVAFTTFFATTGPIDVAAIFAGLTAGQATPQVRATAFKGVAVATGILMAFALFGNGVLTYMGITLAALRTAGGILLLLIGINLVLARPSGILTTTKDEAAEAVNKPDISVFPLATPLIAGPGTMGAVILLMAEASGNIQLQAVVIGALIAVLTLSLALLLAAAQVQRLFGVTGLNVVSRIMGVVLTALAVQFIFDGIKGSGLIS